MGSLKHDREPYVEKGRAYLKVNFRTGTGTGYKKHACEIVEVARAACKIRTLHDGTERTVRLNELEPDWDWLDEQDRLEREKRERIARESSVVELAPPPAPPQQSPRVVVRLVEEAKPLKTHALADALQRAAEKPLKALPKNKKSTAIVHPEAVAPAQLPAEPTFEQWVGMGAVMRHKLENQLLELQLQLDPLEHQVTVLLEQKLETKRKIEALERVLSATFGAPA